MNTISSVADLCRNIYEYMQLRIRLPRADQVYYIIMLPLLQLFNNLLPRTLDNYINNSEQSEIYIMTDYCPNYRNVMLHNGYAQLPDELHQVNNNYVMITQIR